MKTARESQYDEEIEGKRRGHPPPTKPQTKAPVQSQLTTKVKHTEPAIRPTGDKPKVKHYKVDLKEHYKVDLNSLASGINTLKRFPHMAPIPLAVVNNYCLTP